MKSQGAEQKQLIFVIIPFIILRGIKESVCSNSGFIPLLAFTFESKQKINVHFLCLKFMCDSQICSLYFFTFLQTLPVRML